MPNMDDESNSMAYRFVSDPGYKENLSGRVRAACITCRRKKIKCSGEVPCQTCKEKGVVCEGLTQRKRPSKSGDQQKPLDTPAQALRERSAAPSSGNPPKASQDASRRRKPGAVGQESVLPQRPSNMLQRTNTFSSDSGYSSGKQSVLNDSTTTGEPEQDFTQPAAPTYDGLGGISPFAVGTYWTLMAGQNMHGYNSGPGRAGVSPNSLTVPPQISNKAVDWRENENGMSWWPDDSCGQGATDLISAAKALEARAQSLRLLAGEQNVDAMNDQRRQTITFPLPSETNTSFNGTPSYPNGAFDDLAVMMDRLPGTGSGLTPSTSDCNSWLGVDYDHSRALGHQQMLSSQMQGRADHQRGQVKSSHHTGWDYKESLGAQMRMIALADGSQSNPTINTRLPTAPRARAANNQPGRHSFQQPGF